MKSDGTSKGRFDVVYELQKKKKKKILQSENITAYISQLGKQALRHEIMLYAVCCACYITEI